MNKSFLNKGEPVAVICHCAITGAYLGDFDNLSKACRTLFIRKTGSITANIHAKNSKGVKSYKDGRKYSFQLKKNG